MSKKNWHAIYTRSRTEKKVTEHMQKRGYQVYLPLVKTLKQWSDRKKKVEIPLIAGYVFVCVNEEEYYKILETPGTVNYVTFEGKAVAIPENQILAMKTALENNMQVELQQKQFNKGEHVKVIAGPLKGTEGEYVSEAHKQNFIINIQNVGFTLSVEVNANDVVKI